MQKRKRQVVRRYLLSKCPFSEGTIQVILSDRLHHFNKLLEALQIRTNRTHREQTAAH